MSIGQMVFYEKTRNRIHRCYRKWFLFFSLDVWNWKLLTGRRDIRQNDTRHNDTQHQDTQHNGTQLNNKKRGTQHNNIQHNDIQHNDTQHDNKKRNTRHNGIQHNDTRNCYAECRLCWVSFVLSIANMLAIMLSVTLIASLCWMSWRPKRDKISVKTR